MINLSDCILLGTIIKLHGVRGQVILRLNNFSSDKIHKMEWVFIEIDGLPVPFFILEYSEKAGDSFLLEFEDIDNKDKAKELLDAKVFISADNIDVIQNQLSDTENLIGYEVIDKNTGSMGILKEIIDIHQNPLFLILNNKKEILLPAYKDFILNIDSSNKIILVQSPKGLTDLS